MSFPRRRATKRTLFVFSLSAACLWADGHGPAFGLATTVLGAGDASVETALMWRSGVAMISPILSYGVTGNLQLSVSGPFHLNHGEHPVGRFTGMTPGNPEVELLGAWRFHHALTGVGTRNESTLYFGTSVSTQLPPRTDGSPLRRAPGFYMGAATGHISRRYYVWAGAGYETYASLQGIDHQGNSLLGSFVFGWRPPFWDKDYPKPDLRFFWESTGERNGSAWRSAAAPAGAGHHGTPTPLPSPDSNGIIVLPDSGGKGVYSGPTFLCTYRNLAFQAGALFAVWREPNGIQSAERFRAVVGVSYFFLGGRK
jgi:hypothetical protein